MQGNYRVFTAEELVLQYQATQDEGILRELITRNGGLIHGWVINYSNIPQCDYEDLEEECYIALWKAAQSYNPERGIKFTTVLKQYSYQMLNRLYNEKTRAKRYNGTTPESYESLEDINREGGYHDDHSGLELGEFLQSLSDTAKKVAEMLSEGFTKGDVAKALDCAPATVTYYLRQLKKAYTAYYVEV